MTALLLVTLLIMIGLSQFFGAFLRDAYPDIQDQSAAINNHFQETLSDAKLIKACASSNMKSIAFLATIKLIEMPTYLTLSNLNRSVEFQ
jgi:ABC-type bacteriocin/lantibiotic exporter with double-glycine peptidase domain